MTNVILAIMAAISLVAILAESRADTAPELPTAPMFRPTPTPGDVAGTGGVDGADGGGFAGAGAGGTGLGGVGPAMTHEPGGRR